MTGTRNVVTAACIPGGTEISRRLDGAHFHDCYRLTVEPRSQTALEIYLDVASRTPRWVNQLMLLRNRIVMLVGLKNLGGMAHRLRDKPADAYRTGDRIGIFSLLHSTDSEVILGDSDKHLNVQVSISKHPDGDRDAIVIATVVHIHNLLGRLYMVVVTPLHKLIVRAMLRRASQPR
jgi:hypothetical protein